MLLRARDRIVTFPRRPLVMGIINLNDDSFSGDGPLGIDDPAERDAGTIALVASGCLRGANIPRVHNARAAAQALKVLQAITGPA